MLKTADIHILGRILELDGEKISAEKAKLVLSLEFSRADCQRIELLGQKSSNGRLSSREKQEYESYVRVGDILATLKSRARSLLKKIGKTA